MMKRYETYRQIRHDIAHAGDPENKPQEKRARHSHNTMKRVLSKLMSVAPTDEDIETMNMNCRPILFNGKLTDTNDFKVIKAWRTW